MLFYYANSLASGSIFTSKANIHAYYCLRFYGLSDKMDFIAFRIFYLDMGPIDICETGIFYVFKYSSKA